MKKFIKEHKVLSVVISIFIILLIVLIAMIFTIMFGGSDNKYGDRLKGISEVKITGEYLTEVENTLAENDEVSSSSLRIQGKIIYVSIKFKSGTDVNTAESIASKSLEEFSSDELQFYDFEFLLDEETETDEDEGFIKAGTKHPSKEEITWTRG